MRIGASKTWSLLVAASGLFGVLISCGRSNSPFRQFDSGSAGTVTSSPSGPEASVPDRAMGGGQVDARGPGSGGIAGVDAGTDAAGGIGAGGMSGDGGGGAAGGARGGSTSFGGSGGISTGPRTAGITGSGGTTAADSNDAGPADLGARAGANGGGGGSRDAAGSSSDASTSWDDAKIADTGTGWWMIARKGAFFFSVDLEENEDPTSGRREALDFTAAVVGKMPSAGSPDVQTLVPAPNEVAGWVYDPQYDRTAARPAVATSFEELTEIIDGGADSFYLDQLEPVATAWENYVKGNERLTLYVVKLSSVANASMYFSAIQDASLFSAFHWSPL